MSWAKVVLVVAGCMAVTGGRALAQEDPLPTVQICGVPTPVGPPMRELFARDRPTALWLEPALVFYPSRMDRSLEMLGDLIRDTPEGPERGNARFRLAELYYDRWLFFRRRAADRFAEASAGDPVRAVRFVEAAVADIAHSDGVADTALTLLAELRERQGEGFGHGEAQYWMGRLTLSLGRVDEALAHFEALQREHGDNLYVARAAATLGDYYLFERDDVDEARQHYAAAQDPREDWEESRQYAFYQEAWILRDEGSTETALDTMFEAAAVHARDLSASLLQGRIMSDLAVFYVDAGRQPEDIWDFIEPILFSPSSWVESVARVYAEDGRLDEAIAVYRDLIERDPADRWALPYQTEIVRHTMAAGDAEAIVAELERWIAMFHLTEEGPGATPYYGLQALCDIEHTLQAMAEVYAPQALEGDADALWWMESLQALWEKQLEADTPWVP